MWHAKGVALGIAIVVLMSNRTAAQAADTSATQVCTYVRCALTFDGVNIVTGAVGRTERVGFFTGARVVRAVTSVPAAVTEAQRGSSLQTGASVVASAGALGLGYFLLQGVLPRRDFPVIANPVRFGNELLKGLGLFAISGAISIPLASRARRHYERSFVIYNATLPR